MAAKSKTTKQVESSDTITLPPIPLVRHAGEGNRATDAASHWFDINRARAEINDLSWYGILLEQVHGLGAARNLDEAIFHIEELVSYVPRLKSDLIYTIFPETPEADLSDEQSASE